MAVRRLQGLAQAAQAVLSGNDSRGDVASLADAEDAPQTPPPPRGATPEGVPLGGAGDRRLAYGYCRGRAIEAQEVEEDMPTASSSSSAPVTHLPFIVHLNVGGELHTTTLSTLRRFPGSHISWMFSGQAPVARDIDGRFCIDRDGEAFHHVLNFLRDGSAPLGLSRGMRVAVLREAQYFGLKELHRVLGGVQDITTRRGDSPTSRSYASAGSAGAGRHLPANSFELLSRAARGDGQRLYDASVQDFLPTSQPKRLFARLRYGPEYSGGWVVSSPRNIPGVEYELHSACLARGPIAALNKMCKAGWTPCDNPPRAPPVSDLYTDRWAIQMYTEDPKVIAGWDRQVSGDQWSKRTPLLRKETPQAATRGDGPADRGCEPPRMSLTSVHLPGSVVVADAALACPLSAPGQAHELSL